MEWYGILAAVLGGAALLMLIAVAAVAAGLYRFAIPRKKEQPRPEGELPFEKMMHKNKKDYYLPYVQAGVDWMVAHRAEAEEVYTSSEDGLRLHAALFTVEDPVGLIVLCHGYRSCGEADFGPVLPFYRAQRMNVLLIDHRAHGRSEGKRICFAVKERFDLRVWLNYAAKRFPDLPLFAAGISMGSATVVYALELPGLPKQLCGALADCGYDDPAEEVSYFARTRFGLRCAPLFIRTANLYCRLFARFSLYDCRATRDASKIGVPVMVLHGTKDDVVPYENGERIYAAIPGEKRMFTGNDALHGCSFLEEPERWKKEVSDFLAFCRSR